MNVFIRLNKCGRLLLLLAIIAGGGIHAALLGQIYDLKRFQADNGLTEDYVYSVIQDDLDFLWISSTSGLYRFDGKEFVNYRKEDGLASTFTNCSFKDAHGKIWFGHGNGSVTVLDKLSFNDTIVGENAYSSKVTAIAQDEKGFLWVALQREGLLRIDSTDESFHLLDRNLDDLSINGLATLPNNGLLIGTDEGPLVCRYDGSDITNPERIPGFPLEAVTVVLAREGRNSYWLGSEESGLFQYFPDRADPEKRLIAYGPEKLLGVSQIKSLYETKDRRLWVGTAYNGFRIFDCGTTDDSLIPFQPQETADTASTDVIAHIYQDKFGQMWLATYGEGLVCVAEKPIAMYGIEVPGENTTDNTPQDLPNAVNDICESQDGTFWYATNRGLYEVKASAIRNFGHRYSLGGELNIPAVRRLGKNVGLPTNAITAVAEDQYGTIWIGTREDGVWKLSADRKSFTRIDFSQLLLPNMIREVTPEGDLLWIGTFDGVFTYHLKTGRTDFYWTQNGLPHNNIHHIYADPDDRIWFSTFTNRIAYFDGQGMKQIPIQDGEENSQIVNLTSNDEGLWAASLGTGLYKIVGDSITRFMDRKENDQDDDNGLLSIFCHQVLTDRSGNVWVTHRNGFSRYITRTNTVLKYPFSDYFKAPDNNPNAFMADSRDNLWVGTNSGIVYHNWVPSRTRITAPHIVISSAELSGGNEDSTYAALGSELPFGNYRLRVEYLGLTFLDQEKVVYQYKLEGRDSEWSEVSTDNVTILQGLSDGDYTFKVRSRSPFGNWNTLPQEFSFSILPPFWKTWWFILLCSLTIAGLIYMYIRYRFYRLEAEKLALEKKVEERTVALKKEKEKLETANLELEKLSLVASETDNAVFIIDAEGNLEWINPGFTRLTGYSMDELSQLHSGRSFLTLSSNSQIGHLVQEVVRTNTSIQYESKLPSKKGETIWVISTLTPILDQNGNLRKIVIIDSNITERKEAEQRVKNLNEELEAKVRERTAELALANTQLQRENVEHIKTAQRLKATNEELDSFVYRASHDLKGPLASLLGLVNIAKAELGDNEIATRYLDLMERRGQRLDSILVDLIEATQVKQSTVELRQFAPREIIDHIVELTQSKADCREAEFVVNVPEELTFVSDRKLVRSILQNYIENSAKYGDPGKDKTISTTNIHLENGHIEIRVSDNGVGIPDSVRERIFDMFYRGTNQVSGSGLGLYIVKQAVEKLGGEVDVESVVGEGTTFIARIPNHPVSAAVVR